MGSTDATGSAARFYWPGGSAVDSADIVYVADTQNGTIRKVTTAGVVSTLAGSAGNFGGADGTGTNAQFFGPQGIAVDGAGAVYVADTVNATIRKIAAGVVTTLAGAAGNIGVADGKVLRATRPGSGQLGHGVCGRHLESHDPEDHSSGGSEHAGGCAGQLWFQ
jgi:sugar lactone lactonase YvrE